MTRMGRVKIPLAHRARSGEGDDEAGQQVWAFLGGTGPAVGSGKTLRIGRGLSMTRTGPPGISTEAALKDWRLKKNQNVWGENTRK